MLKKIRVLIWDVFVNIYPWYLRLIYKMEIGSNTRISWNAHMDLSINPKGIKIGNNCLITRGCYLLAHDVSRNLVKGISIGNGCFVGVGAIILPGVNIGDNCIIGAGAVVTKDIPPYSLWTGNPARQRGWVSRAGHKLTFNKQGTAVCPETGERYIMENNQVKQAK